MTHSLGVLCATCRGELVSDACRCGTPHGSTLQEANDYARRTWPDHGCFHDGP